MRPPRTLSGSDTPAEGMRERAYGQEYEPTIVDRFGVWLSGYQIRKNTGSFGEKRIGDFGCGYQAAFVRSDRKSTRLNSSHLVISYAVFCLKKKITTVIST